MDLRPLRTKSSRLLDECSRFFGDGLLEEAILPVLNKLI